MTMLKPTLHLFINASKQGLKAHLDDRTTSGLWAGEQCNWHSNNLELEALILAVTYWRAILRNAQNYPQTTSPWCGVLEIRRLSTPPLSVADFPLLPTGSLSQPEFPSSSRSRVQKVLADALPRPNKVAPTEWMLHPIPTSTCSLQVRNFSCGPTSPLFWICKHWLCLGGRRSAGLWSPEISQTSGLAKHIAPPRQQVTASDPQHV